MMLGALGEYINYLRSPTVSAANHEILMRYLREKLKNRILLVGVDLNKLWYIMWLLLFFKRVDLLVPIRKAFQDELFTKRSMT